MTQKRVALVTGANRGIGFEICKQLAAAGLTVVVTARDETNLKQAAEKLRKADHDIHACRLDVTDVESIQQAVTFVEQELGRLDVLVNNAGIALDWRKTTLEVETEVFRETFDTNFFACLDVARACIPLMKKHGYGRIVNVSSGRGSFSKLAADGPAYRISKTALNALTCVMGDELKGTGILVNAATPGWVRTRMTGPNAPRSVTEGAQTAVWLATIPDDGPQGQFFRDNEIFPW